jgi:hypothetical protein
VSPGKKHRRPDFWLGEILDQQLRDRDERPMGMVDGVVLEQREGRPPRVTHLLVGGSTLSARVAGPIGALIRWFAGRYGAGRGAPYRIPWSAVRDVGVDISVDLDARDTPALYWEDWVRRHLVERLPGA